MHNLPRRRGSSKYGVVRASGAFSGLADGWGVILPALLPYFPLIRWPRIKGGGARSNVTSWNALQIWRKVPPPPALITKKENGVWWGLTSLESSMYSTHTAKAPDSVAPHGRDSCSVRSIRRHDPDTFTMVPYFFFFFFASTHRRLAGCGGTAFPFLVILPNQIETYFLEVQLLLRARRTRNDERSR